MKPVTIEGGELQPKVIKGKALEDSFSQLCDECFGLPVKNTYLSDFPIWSENFSHMTIRIGFESQGKMVASAGLRMAWVDTPRGVPFKVGIIGAVTTHEKFRGQGLASKVVNYLADHGASAGCDVVVLWGAEHSLYQRLGFELCGVQWRVPVNALPLGSSDSKVKRGWTQELAARVAQREGGLKWEKDTEALYAAHKNVQWFWNQGAYAAVGRGIDLPNIIHEWGGEKQALGELLGTLVNAEPKLEIIGNPDLFGAKFPGIEVPVTQEFLCMARVVNPSKIIEAHTGRQIQFEKQSEGWILKAKEPVNLNDRELSQFIFGPMEMGEESGILVPMWFWGLDSA